MDQRKRWSHWKHKRGWTHEQLSVPVEMRVAMYPLASFPGSCVGEEPGNEAMYPHVLVLAITLCTLLSVDVDSKERGGGREKF